MDNIERNKYLKAYYENESDANKRMSFANGAAGIVLFIIWMLYLTKVFPVHQNIYLLLNIFLPIQIIILFTPAFCYKYKRELLDKPRYKYFVIFTFIFVIGLLNIVVPKHGIIGWALCIIITNHYYNPKLGKITYGIVMVSMLLCLYLGMFIGEYDPNLLGGGIIINNKIVYVDSIRERYNMLKNLLANGENRYLKVFAYYYVSRGTLLSLLFYVSNALNKRTYKLLVEEIKVSAEQQKTKNELEVAREIQLSTLPVELISNKDIEIQAELKAAKEVGGDFYDYFILDDDNIAITIGDVSGKGIPAAMFMMKVVTCIKNYISVDKTPAETLRLVNKSIFSGNNSYMFVTCFLAIINTKTGVVQYSNAGHNPPIIGSSGNYHFLNCSSGFVLGGLNEAIVSDESFVLKNGETITLYTDGITEAKNQNNELYGEQRLIKLFNRKEYSCLVELHHELKDDIDKFCDGAIQNDDITYLTLKYHGDEYVYEEKTFNALKDEIPLMFNYLTNFFVKHNLNQTFLNNLLIVGDELLSNIIKYGYDDHLDGKIFIRILFNKNKNELILTVIDNGKPFNPFSVENQAISKDDMKREVGGLGILIVKNLMSEYAYDYINGKNIIILKKNF